jgi:hypothetical protein
MKYQPKQNLVQRVVAPLRTAAGLDVDKAREVLDNPTLELGEMSDQLQKFTRGVSGVPYFIVSDGTRWGRGLSPVCLSGGVVLPVGLTVRKADEIHLLLRFASLTVSR